MAKLFAGILVIALAIVALNFVVGTADETADVAREEFGPRAMLDKYEWFKNASAQLDAKVADIKLAEAKLAGLEESYKGVPRGQWPRDDRQQHSLYSSELQGVKASYNQLADEYNSAMSKFNYRFTNVGDLPAGATEPLPREYKPYITN